MSMLEGEGCVSSVGGRGYASNVDSRGLFSVGGVSSVIVLFTAPAIFIVMTSL